MGKLEKMDERGRILIPKFLREELGLKPGQKILIERRGKEIALRSVRNVKAILSELRACIKKPSKLKPLEVKKIWEKK